MCRIKVLYRRNLKMSEGKLAAQVAWAVLGLARKNPQNFDRIVVLKASDKQFNEAISENAYVQSDMGFTELPRGTETAIAWYEG